MAVLTICSVVTFAQSKEKSQKEKQATDTSIIYSCPMHPEVTLKHKGKCSKCRMDLTAPKKAAKKKDNAKSFTCPMHPKESSSKAGSCSICGMDLEEKKSE